MRHEEEMPSREESRAERIALKRAMYERAPLFVKMRAQIRAELAAEGTR